MNECPICGGNLRSKLVNICACDTLPATIVKNVPALVCEICGEKVLLQRAIDAFQNIRRGIAPKPKLETCRVYDYQSIENYQRFSNIRYASAVPSGTGTAGRVFESVGAGAASTQTT